MHLHPEGSTNKAVGSQLTLTCEPDYWLKSSRAGQPVTTQNITCQSSGEWSSAENCDLIRKFKSILLTLFLKPFNLEYVICFFNTLSI